MIQQPENNPTQSYTTSMFDYNGPFQEAITIAHHYGFHLVKPIDTDQTTYDENEYFHDSYKTDCGTRCKKITQQGPDLVCHTQNPRRKIGTLILEAHGCKESIADGIVLKTGLAILKHNGVKDVLIELNSLGDLDSQHKFRRHFTDFIKKNIQKIPPEYQSHVRTNPFFAARLASRDPDLQKVFLDAPLPLNYLSESDRRHLSEVIEYLESIGVPYRLNPQLLGTDSSPSHTFFKIIKSDSDSLKNTKKESQYEPETIAWGERFEIKESKNNQRHSIVSLSIKLPGGKAESYREKKEEEKPKLYFVHIGNEAKRIGFKVLDVLRETQIPVKQYLIRNSLSEQMASAEAANPSHILIMGMKEAQENTVIVRNTSTRAQTVVEIPRLKTYLKNSIKF